MKKIFKITDGDFQNQEYGTEDYLVNWPMLYILENGKQAYIGQSNHVKTRMAEHHNSEDKKKFRTVHFIHSKSFHQSATLDYEAKLIQYFAADGQFEIQNKNAGIADKDYFNKKFYDENFHILWEMLMKKKLARHSLEEIEQTDLFKYSPYKELNDEQRAAVERILSELLEGNGHMIIVEGMPGSGKTIVAVYLLKYLKDREEFQDMSIGLVIPQMSLRKTLRKMVKTVYGLTRADILSPADITRKKYDILLVDEAHRLHRYINIAYRGAYIKAAERIGLAPEKDELDWILHQCRQSVLFYDEGQVVGPSGISESLLQEKIEEDRERRGVKYHALVSQMRVKGGGIM